LDTSDAFGTEGIILTDDGVGVFAGSGSPVGASAIKGSSYFDKDTGEQWTKYGALDSEWRLSSYYFQLDHNNIVSSSGITVVNPNYTRNGLGHGSGLDTFPESTLCKFGAVANRGTSTSIDVRLYDLDSATELAALNFTEQTPTFKEVAFTPPSGNFAAEVQSRKVGGGTSGELFWGTIIAHRIKV